MKKIPLIAAILLAASALPATARLNSKQQDIDESLSIFNALFKEVQLNYVDSLDARKSVNTAIEAMLDEIDPYTEYFKREDTEDLSRIATGEYGGVGSTINKGRDGRIRFSEPYENAPAAKAGVMGGDVILQIDTTVITPSHSVAEVSALLRGTPSTELFVKLMRPYAADSIKNITIVREKVQIPTIPFYGLVGPDKNIGYVEITSFTEQAPVEVRDAVNTLMKQGATAIVLDLQDNPGGLLESAVQIASIFVPKGTEIVNTQGRNGSNKRVYTTEKEPLSTKIPLAILIDAASASSSEILAGAMQDLDRAVIIGERSFGKGLVQTSRSLPYDAAVKITVAKYYIPSGRLIQAIDYSHRNADGSVARTPDSLTNVFKTIHGRQVRDGGGITPDVKTDFLQNSLLLQTIGAGGYDIDYATKFHAEHPTIPAPADFVITDSILDDFAAFLEANNLKYEHSYEKPMQTLRDVVKRENMLTEEVDSQFNRLSELLRPSLSDNLKNNRKSVEYVLTFSIIPRYYYQRGTSEAVLRFNNPLTKAIEILSDPKEYKEILK